MSKFKKMLNESISGLDEKTVDELDSLHEAAVAREAAKLSKQKIGELTESHQKEIESMKKKLDESVSRSDVRAQFGTQFDKFLTESTKDYFNTHERAIAKSTKTNLAESILHQIVKTLANSDIVINADASKRISMTEAALAKSRHQVRKLLAENASLKMDEQTKIRSNIVGELCESTELTDVQKEEILHLSESLSFPNEEKFKKSVGHLIEALKEAEDEDDPKPDDDDKGGDDKDKGKDEDKKKMDESVQGDPLLGVLLQG